MIDKVCFCWSGTVFRCAVAALLLIVANVTPLSAQDADDAAQDDSMAVMEGFNQKILADDGAYKLTEETKHQVLFVMGALLLILIAFTVYFGVSMGLSGKSLFLQHMICAGLTVTLAIAHAVAAMVWFFPF